MLSDAREDECRRRAGEGPTMERQRATNDSGEKERGLGWRRIAGEGGKRRERKRREREEEERKRKGRKTADGVFKRLRGNPTSFGSRKDDGLWCVLYEKKTIAAVWSRNRSNRLMKLMAI